MTIEDFLEILQDRDLVPAPVVEQVRSKVAKGDRRITPKSLLKYLVKKEYVTKRQAKQLLETTLTVTPNAESSILGMVPMPKMPAAEKPKSSSVFDDSEDDIPTITPVEPSAGSFVTDDAPRAGSGVDLFGEGPASLVSESLSKIGVNDATLSKAIQEGNEERAPEDKKQHEKKKKKAKKSEWDSNLILLGGGGLILLIITGVIIFYLLTRENADAILAEAAEFYEGGSYTQAIKQYDRFIENNSGHPEFSAAKVKVGLARLWKASTGTSNYREALTVAQQVLGQISDEEDFGTDAQQELASLLPDIAKGLANQAENATDDSIVQELVEQSNEALAFCANTKYIPKKFRDEALITEIDQTLERVERSRAEKQALQQALAAMQTAIETRETAKAYQIHEQLLDEHPSLINNEPLAEKVLQISEAESAVVQFVSEPQTAETNSRPRQVVAELALANRSGATGAASGTVAVRVSGAVYGFDVSGGSLRWRRFVGMAPRLTPVRLGNGDLLVVDSHHNELLKLSGDAGELLWRHPFESEVTRPVVHEGRILVNETSGKLHVLNLDSGESSGYVQFAQRLAASPAVGSQGKRVYVVGEHSSFYTLSSTDFSCLGVFFLGHAKGSVVVPPVQVLNKVVVGVAKGISTSQLQALALNADGIPTQIATSRRLSGLVNTQLLTQGRRLIAMTSRGEVDAYEVGSGGGDEALTQIAKRDSVRGESIARFGLALDGHVWVAGPKLNKLAILPTSDRLAVRDIDDDYSGDIFDHDLQTIGNLIIHVRRPADAAGAIVGAMTLGTGQAQWETEVAASPAGPPAVDPTGIQIGAVNSTGAAYLVDREAMRSRVVNSAMKRNPGSLPVLTHSLDLGEGRVLASAAGSDTMLHFRPDKPRGVAKKIQLVAPLSCPPAAWQDGFVTPTQAGQVFLYSVDGEQWGSPFQPPLEPGIQYEWNTPAVYGSGDGSQLVLSDGTKYVYLLERVLSPRPHLTAVETADISTAPLNTRFAVIADLAIAGAEDGSLATFQLPSLTPGESVNLGGLVTWGPYNADENLLLATSTEELVCLDEQASIKWRIPLQHGPPAGQPITFNGGVELLWQAGGISRIELSDGAESTFQPLPQPVVAGPVPFGKRLVVAAYDGTLLIVNHPE